MSSVFEGIPNAYAAYKRPPDDDPDVVLLFIALALVVIYLILN